MARRLVKGGRAPNEGLPILSVPWDGCLPVRRRAHLQQRPNPRRSWRRQWEKVCNILKNPRILELEDQDSTQRSGVQENVDTLRAQRQKLQHGMDRLIDSLAEGVIEKDQFTARINRTKARIADIEAEITAHTSDEGRQAHLRSVRSRLTEISATCRTSSAMQTGPPSVRLSAPLFSG